MKITFLGAGTFGKALANIAKYNGHETKFYDPIKFPDISLQSAIAGADIVVFVAPSEKAAELLPKLDQETPLICASKGFFSQKSFESFSNFSVLSGAAFAKDIESTFNDKEAKPLTLTTTSELSETIFSTEKITIEYTKDTLGVLLCGTLKNIYAIGAGLYGESGDTATLSYLETTISEMLSILSANHADPETLRLSCGAADLVLSCSNSSRNFRYGLFLKNQGSSFDHSATIEGLNAIKALPNYPEFILPNSATIFKDIVKTVNQDLAQ